MIWAQGDSMWELDKCVSFSYSLIKINKTKGGNMTSPTRKTLRHTQRTLRYTNGLLLVGSYLHLWIKLKKIIVPFKHIIAARHVVINCGCINWIKAKLRPLLSRRLSKSTSNSNYSLVFYTILSLSHKKPKLCQGLSGNLDMNYLCYKDRLMITYHQELYIDKMRWKHNHLC